MERSKIIWAAVLVGALALGARLPGLGAFMTVDEENWIIRSSHFYHKLFIERHPPGTYLTTHPGATAMWIIGAGVVVQEARLGTGADQSNIGLFRAAALWPMVLVISGLLGLTAYLLMRAFGFWPGLVAAALLSLEPYLVGMSQIAHVDMLLALLMLDAVLVFLTPTLAFGEYSPFVRGRKFLMILCGILTGLAAATKLMPSVWLFVFFAIYLAYQYRFRVGEIIRRLGFLFGVAALTFHVVWPTMWTNPDILYAVTRDATRVVQDVHVETEQSEEPISPLSFYARTVLGRTTPFVLILSVAGIIYPLLRLPAGSGEKQWGWNVVWLLIYAIGFLVMITLAAKKADRYALPALVALPVIAGWALGRVHSHLHTRCGNLVTTPGVVTVGMLLIAQIWVWSPYTIAYNSPLFDVRPLPQQGWGEGLEAAAAWLNAQSRSEETFIASWYPSVMQVFFKGKTLSLSSREDDRIGFVVLYRNMQGRGPDDIATNVLQEFQGRQPVHVVEIQGVPYVWIYDVRGLYYFPQHVGELFGQKTIGQLVPVNQDNWRAIEIGLATFSSRNNTQDVILHVRENIEATEDVRSVRASAQDIQDSSYHRFEFEPITDAAGKTFYVFLDSPTSQPGDAITVRFANDDVLPGEMVKDDQVLPGRDIAYRIP